MKNRDKYYIRHKLLLIDNERVRKEIKSLKSSSDCENKINRRQSVLFQCLQIQHDLIHQAKKHWPRINWYKFNGLSTKVINLETD